MLFNSYEFLFLFLPLTLWAWSFTGRRFGASAARHTLLVASLVFYATSGLNFLLLLVASMVFNFWVGHRLSRDSGSTTANRALLTVAITANLATLGWFKYAHFLADNLNSVFQTHWVLGQIVLPLGISFHTFQQIAFLVDAHRKLTREYSFADYCLFVSFFPQLVAGPIVHHGDLVPQFRQQRNGGLEAGNLAAGITMFSVGLAKKVLIADQLGRNSSSVFGAVASHLPVTAGDAWLGLLAYTFQIYFDFSGYSDMAVGLGLMFGIKLPFNFNSPYAAESLIDFWRRWHITLSNFIRDYLYIPLGGNRMGPSRTYLNLFLVMTVTGLWHGANWTFILWGALHGLGLLINHGWRQLRSPPPSNRPAWGSWALTLLFVMLGWVLFRANNLETAGRYLTALAQNPFHWEGSVLIRDRYWVYFVLLVLVVRFLPNSQEIVLGAKDKRFLPSWTGPLRWRPNQPWAWGLGLLFGACVLSLSNFSEFLYWQF